MDGPQQSPHPGQAARRLADRRVQVRVPLIPGITDTAENLQGIFEFMRRSRLAKRVPAALQPLSRCQVPEWLGLDCEIQAEPQDGGRIEDMLSMARRRWAWRRLPGKRYFREMLSHERHGRPVRPCIVVEPVVEDGHHGEPVRTRLFRSRNAASVRPVQRAGGIAPHRNSLSPWCQRAGGRLRCRGPDADPGPAQFPEAPVHVRRHFR